MKLLFVFVIFGCQIYVEGSCNVHSGEEHYSCTKYSSVKYSYTVPCGFWHWLRCFRTKYSSTAHQSLCSRKCTVDGDWSTWQAWGSWGSCDQTCGDAIRIRYSVRNCNNPAPKNGGKGCLGKNTRKDTEICKLKECPVNGGWSSYGSWSKPECPVTCGGGHKTQYRYRACNNPIPKYGGRNCSGTSVLTHTTPCNTNPCEVSSIGNETVSSTNETENESSSSKENGFNISSDTGNDTVSNITNQTSGGSLSNQVTINAITGTPDDRGPTTPRAETSSKNENQTEE
ncbi:coadhesin-like [Saccostrea cucullata]|uniref:coadhesin-like n=1 Tax=Saccostrea cuccullata TaxID=36930 RepID=UPI002ED0120C